MKTSLSLRPSPVNTVALTGLLRRVGLSLSCLSLENTLAVCEECVPLDAVIGLCFLLLGLFFLLHDSDSENWSRVIVCRVVVILLAERLMLGRFGSFRVLGLGILLIVWLGLAARLILYVISYARSVKVKDVLILHNVSVFTPKPSKHYLNITLRNIVKVFDKDTD
ncbi:zinc finger BED domain-containing protein RICESLEEPER 2-like protein [Tanacetum coccineum]